MNFTDSSSNPKKTHHRSVTKVKRFKGSGLKIVDDTEDTLVFGGVKEKKKLVLPEAGSDDEVDELPIFVGLVDERPLEIQAMDEFKVKSKWRQVADDVVDVQTGQYSPSVLKKLMTNSISKRSNRSRSSSATRNRRGSTESPHRRKQLRNSSPSPPSRKSTPSPPRRNRKMSSPSPPRRNRKMGTPSPPRRNRKMGTPSPSRRNRKMGTPSPPRRNRKMSTPSPPRRNRKTSTSSPPRGNRKMSSPSPPRQNRKSRSPGSPRRNRNIGSPSTTRKNKKHEISSPLRRYKKSITPSPPRNTTSSPRRNRKSKSISPSRRRNVVPNTPSPPRRNRDSSPPRRGRNTVPTPSPPRRHRNSSPSPRRYRNSSPPSRPSRNSSPSPQRQSNSLSSSSRRQRNSSPSPTRNRMSPPWRNRRDSPPRKSGGSSNRPTPSNDDHTKMDKTLDGKQAGLQRASALRGEMVEHRQRESQFFESLDDSVSGRNAKTILRDRKTGTKRDLAAEAKVNEEKQKLANERKEQYDKWGKGLKQVEQHEDKIVSTMHEMSKPLARYKDDEDLDKYLKNQDRDGDPMLKFLSKSNKKSGKPAYNGPPPPPNRFQVPPGCRWDGVDRSNGYEKEWFSKINTRKALVEEAYKWSVEDL